MGQRIVNKKSNSINLDFEKKLRQAVAVRDALPPKLMSGDVDVRNTSD
ncbi:MAG: hypothetical protein HZA11_14485 [Nitrospirae bacterium]|nr:hypothetical protein [Nitrospirota bacterium]